jgi:predicted Zn-dependent protease
MLKTGPFIPQMLFLSMVCFLLALAMGCATMGPKPVTDDFLAQTDEKMLWEQAAKEQAVLDGSGMLYKNDALEKYLNQVARSMQPPDLSAELTFQIKVIKDPYLNAFAFPNGVIYVHSGLLARMDNEAQLAALLSHEMAHCIQRHALKVYRSIRDAYGFSPAVDGGVAKNNGIKHIARFLGLAGSMAAVTGYKRELETEADILGLEFMIQAGYDPYEVLQLFEHLKLEIEKEGIIEPFFFGTHPKVRTRTENLTSLLAANHPVRAGIKNRVKFLARLQGVVLDNAWLDLRLGRFSTAQRGVQKYLKISHNDAQAYYLQGEIFRQRGQDNDGKAALTSYEKAISIDPTFRDPHKAIGLIHFKKGQKNLAKKFFESCLMLAPDAPDKEYIQGYLNHCTSKGEG